VSGCSGIRRQNQNATAFLSNGDHYLFGQIYSGPQIEVILAGVQLLEQKKDVYQERLQELQLADYIARRDNGMISHSI
jgi:hypothetical protein